jgi:hypothetical protein
MSQFMSLGAKGAILAKANEQYTGSFIALQPILSGSSPISINAHLATGTSGSAFTEFGSIEWGNIQDAYVSGSGNTGAEKVHSTSSAATNVRAAVGQMVHGPVFSFKVNSGSCLAYKF